MTKEQKQIVFNKVRSHLLAQGKRAEKDGGCRYRGPNGTKCAVGCLIPDHLYRSALEGAVPGGSLLRGELGTYFLKTYGIERSPAGEDAKFLTGLQQIHDNGSVKDWDESLREFAAKEGLEVE